MRFSGGRSLVYLSYPSTKLDPVQVLLTPRPWLKVSATRSNGLPSFRCRYCRSHRLPGYRRSPRRFRRKLLLRSSPWTSSRFCRCRCYRYRRSIRQRGRPTRRRLARSCAMRSNGGPTSAFRCCLSIKSGWVGLLPILRNLGLSYVMSFSGSVNSMFPLFPSIWLGSASRSLIPRL